MKSSCESHRIFFYLFDRSKKWSMLWTERKIPIRNIKLNLRHFFSYLQYGLHHSNAQWFFVACEQLMLTGHKSRAAQPIFMACFLALSLCVCRYVFRSPDSAMRPMVYAFLSLESVVLCSPVQFCFEFSIERVFVFVNLFTSFVHCLLCVVACCVCCQYECPMSISTQSSFDQHNNLSLCADDDQPLNVQYFFLLPPMGHSSPSSQKG